MICANAPAFSATVSDIAVETVLRHDAPLLQRTPQGRPQRQRGLWATLRRAGSRVGRWLAKAARWVSSPKGELCLTLAGEAVVAAGMLSRAAVADALDAVALGAAPFAPSAARREGPRVIWG